MRNWQVTSQEMLVKHIGEKGPGMSDDEWAQNRAQRAAFLTRETKIMLELAKAKVPGVGHIVAAASIDGSPAIIMKNAGPT